MASRALRPHESWAAWDMGVGHRPDWLGRGGLGCRVCEGWQETEDLCPQQGWPRWGESPQPLHIWAPKKQTKNNTALETLLLGEGSLVPM